MVYKRFVKKKGKTFGPYYYESYREGGVVKKKYLGANFYSNDKEPKKKINWVIFVLIIGLISILMILFLRASFQPSGKVVLHIDDSYKVNETITGNLNLLLKSGELLPEDTKVIINLAGEEKEYLLNDLLDINKSEGNFYAENINLTGSGGGYGFIGEIKTPVDVNFKLRIRQLKEGEIVENITEIENVTEVENITETQGNITEIEENITETEKNVSEAEVPEENITIEEKPEEKPKEEKKEITEEQIVEEVVQETLTEKGVEDVGVSGKQVAEEKKQEKKEEVAAEAEASISSESSEEESSSSESGGNAGITGAVIETNFFRNILSKFTEMRKYSINGKLTSISRITGKAIEQIENTTQERLTEQEIQNIENKVEEKITEIKEKDNLIVDGILNANSEFSYDLENKTAEIIEGSVDSEGEKLKEDVLDLKIKDNKAIVTTSYSKIEKGFGQEYLGSEQNTIAINLEKLNLTAKQGKLTVKLVYNDILIVEASEDLLLEGLSLTTNLTLNITANATIQTLQYQARLGKPVKWEKNVKLEKPEIVRVELPKLASNITVYKIVGEEEIEVKEGAITPVTNETQQTTIGITGIIGIEEENATTEENITSENVTGITPEVSGTENTTQITEEARLKEIENTTETQVTEQAIEQTTQTAENTQIQPEIIEKNKEGKKEVEVSKDKIEITGRIISGKISAEIDLNKKPAITRFFTKIIKMITGRAIETIQQQEIIEVKIQDNASEYKVNYETPAPQAYEENITNGKKITISAPDELNYTNILAYTFLAKEASQEKVKLYWIKQENITVYNNETNENITQVVETREKVDITSYDTNNNSLIDYIEWVVPHLSSQTYELVIEISKAEHLDENRTFISDIYEQVKTLDGNWSEPIYNNEYVRVTFSQNLTKDRDITVYARNTQQENTKIQVYEKEKNESIAEFPAINGREYYKVYLSNLPEDYSQDTFDLKIVNTDNKSEVYLDFDYIVDPDTTPPNIIFVSPTPNNATTTANTSFSVNISITDLNLASVVYNWNGTNTSFFDSTVILKINFDNMSSLGENGTMVKDLSANNNSGILINGTSFVKGKFGKSAKFDGINDYIQLPDMADYKLGLNNFSIVFWVNYSGETSTYQRVLDYSDAVGSIGTWTLYKPQNSANLSWVQQGIVDTATRCGLENDTWVFFVIVRNADNHTFYKNGNICDSKLFAGSDYNKSMILKIGGYQGSGYFNGSVDELLFFKKTLSSNEINQLYSGYLYKSNLTEWNFFINQSKNATAGLDTGTYTYQAHASDTIPNWNSTDFRTIIIGTADTTPPDINLTYPLNITYTTNVNQLNYTVGNDATFCMYYNGTSNATITTCGQNLTGLISAEGSNTWIVYANDSTGNQNTSKVTFVKDTVYPIFSNFLDNNATYSGQLARFNVTITSTNGTVQLNLNATNYTASNLTATVFNVTINLTATGNYNYSWLSWGNGSLNNYNTSSLRWFSVNATPTDTTSPTFTAISSNKSWIYPGTKFSVDFNATDNSAISSYQINWTEKFNISSNDGVLQNYTSLGVGIYLINVSVNDTSNNFAFLIYTIEVNKSGSNVTVYIDGLSQNKSVYNGTKVWLNATLIQGDTGNIYLYNNQTLINNATSSPATNYTNFTNIGFYNISAYYTGSENYSSNWSKILFVNVTQTPDATPPIFTDISQNKSFIYNAQGIASDFNATDASGISSYFINWTEKFNISSNDGLLQNTTTLGGGIYQINVSVNDTSGNTGFLIYTVEVNQSGATNLSLYLDGLSINKTIYTGVKVWLNASLITGDSNKNIYLYNNGSLINNGTSPAVNYTNFTGKGSYNISAYYLGSENYTANWSKNLFVDVSDYSDTTPPTFTNILANLSFVYNTQKVDIDFNATDTESPISSFTINQTDKFNITSLGGWMQNITSIGTGVWRVNVSVNDTSGNTGFLIFTVEVNKSNSANVTLYLDGLTQNKTITASTKVYLNASLLVGDNGNLELYSNQSLINNATSPATNYTNFTTAGNYNITSFYYGNENYSSKWGGYNLWVHVNSIPDTTPPIFTDISQNKSFIYNAQGIASDFNATDASGISSYFINWTEKFNISSNDGLLQNTTTLGVGIYRINVSANDTLGNTGFLIFTVEVNKSGSNITTYIDGLSQNKSVANGTLVWLNATLIQGDTGNIYLYNNQTLINNATISPAVNQTNFTNLGDYNISAWYLGSENYSENWSRIIFVNITYTPATAATSVTTTEVTGTGGGGGGAVAPITGLRVNPIGISLYGTAGISDIGKISISNDKNTQITVGISLVNIGSIINLKETSMELAPKESKILDFDYISAEAGIYTGKIVFSSAGQIIQIPIALNIKSGKSLFDISVDIPEQYKQINPGNMLTSQITLVQAGVKEKMDVTLNYMIKDFEGKTHLKESETLAVQGQKSYSKEFQTQNLPVGDYVLGTEVIHSGGVATASSQFTIKEATLKTPNILFFIVLIAAIIVFILLIVLIRRYKKQNYLYRTSRIDKK